MDPMPIGRVNIEDVAKRHGARERRIDLDLSDLSSRGHNEGTTCSKGPMSRARGTQSPGKKAVLG